MNTVQSRFERFAAFAFSSSSTFDKGVDLWDAISHYEFYLTDGEPNETFLQKMEELGCSRRWLMYANGEMFADNEQGKLLRYKFMQGIGLTNKKFSFEKAFPPYVPTHKGMGAMPENEIAAIEEPAVSKAKSTGKQRKVVKKSNTL